jgi:hypothetical protein
MQINDGDELKFSFLSENNGTRKIAINPISSN